jgi:uncharacterized metal-binding protein
MPKLPEKKVGIIACSGEEMAEGTVTRLAALRVLEELRPSDTVTICLPLFLAGGEGDRAFARFYPTIAIDGCELRCAARATEQHSGKPAASIVVSDVIAANAIGQVSAAQASELVDTLLDKKWSRRQGRFVESEPISLTVEQPQGAICACGSGIPVQTVQLNGESITLVALPVLFEQFLQDGKRPSAETIAELLEQVKIYNPVPAGTEPAYREMLAREYALFYGQEVVTA